MSPRVAHLSSNVISGGASIAAHRIHEALLASDESSAFYVDNPEYMSKDFVTQSKLYRRLIRPVRTRVARILEPTLMFNRQLHLSTNRLPSRWLSTINAADIDVLNLHWFHPEMLSIEDLGRVRHPLVWTMHDLWPIAGAQHLPSGTDWEAGFLQKLPRSKLAQLDRRTWLRKQNIFSSQEIEFIAPSTYLRDLFSKSALFDKKNISVVPHPLDTEKIWKPENKCRARAKLNLDQNRIYLLFCSAGGFLTRHKGYERIRIILKELKKIKAFEAFTLLVVGETRRLPDDIEGIPLKSLGNLRSPHQLKSVYSASDVFISTSKFESFGLVIQEALACGLPVVSTDSGGPRDLIVDGENGYLVSQNQSKEFATKIADVLRGDLSISEEALEKWKQSFSYQTVARQYREIYACAIS